MEERPALPWIAIVLGVFAILAGIVGNSIVLLLGVGALVLGILAQTQQRRDLAWWGIASGGLGLLGYVGILTRSST